MYLTAVEEHNLSAPMAIALQALSLGEPHDIHGATMAALKRRGLVDQGNRLTDSGEEAALSLLRELDDYRADASRIVAYGSNGVPYPITDGDAVKETLLGYAEQSPLCRDQLIRAAAEICMDGSYAHVPGPENSRAFFPVADPGAKVIVWFDDNDRVNRVFTATDCRAVDPRNVTDIAELSELLIHAAGGLDEIVRQLLVCA